MVAKYIFLDAYIGIKTSNGISMQRGKITKVRGASLSSMFQTKSEQKSVQQQSRL